MRHLISEDFKKGQKVFLLTPWNVCSAGLHVNYEWYETLQINSDVTIATFKIAELTVHSSGKKVVRFIYDGKLVKWDDIFCYHKGVNVLKLYFTTREEAENHALYLSNTKNIEYKILEDGCPFS